MTDTSNEPRFKAGTPEYETDVIKRARKAATTIGKTLDHYRLIGEALSIMRQRAMVEAGIEGSNKPPSGPKYTKALNAQLDKAPEFLLPEVFESGSARTHAVWLHDCAADVEWTFQIAERAKPGSTRRWNNPTYIWKMWRKLTAEPSKKALDAKATKEAKAKALADELERYREEWREKYVALKAKFEEVTGREFENGAAEPEYIGRSAFTTQVIERDADGYQKPKPKRRGKAEGYMAGSNAALTRKPRKTKDYSTRPDGSKRGEDEVGGYAPGALEAITGKPKRQRKVKENVDLPLDTQEAVN